MEEVQNSLVSWEECSDKETLEKLWKMTARQMSSVERQEEIIRLKKYIWKLEATLLHKKVSLKHV